MNTLSRKIYACLLALAIITTLAGCGDDGESAAKTAEREFQTPQGRVITANQAANNLSLIDVATDRAYATIVTGASPHHVLATPDGKELWVTLYGENRLQVFDPQTL